MVVVDLVELVELVAVVVDSAGHCFGTPKALAAMFAGDRLPAVAVEPHTQLVVVAAVHMQPAAVAEHKRLAAAVDTELAVAEHFVEHMPVVVEHSADVALLHMPLAAADRTPWLVAAPLVAVWHRSLAAAGVVVAA